MQQILIPGLLVQGERFLKMKKFLFGILALFILLVVIKQTNILQPSFWGLEDKIILGNSWNFYKEKFLTVDGRIVDYKQNSITTSEGQAYAMRRALMMEDKETFDKVYIWTQENLKRDEDNLFGWKWGEDRGEYKLLDKNPASDADVEIAAVLISASKIWHNRSYLDDAKKILNDIWEKETVEINGSRILVSGIAQKEDEKNIEINPSYFMPDSFRIFAKVDRNHDWKKLVDSSYKLVDYCIENIDSGLPPDWFYMDAATGKISFKEGRSDFSYDAIRVFYRFYLDYRINREKRAENLLSKANLFINKWKKDKKIYTEYLQNGQPKSDNEAVGCVAILVPVIKLYNKDVAKEIYRNRVDNLYNKDGYWYDPLDYYAQNLAWFGSWLYLDEKNLRAFKY